MVIVVIRGMLMNRYQQVLLLLVAAPAINLVYNAVVSLMFLVALLAGSVAIFKLARLMQDKQVQTMRSTSAIAKR